MNKKDITIWIAVQPDGNPYMFVDEPTKQNGRWVGNYYVNSQIYEQVKVLVKQSQMTKDTEPQPITFVCESK